MAFRVTGPLQGVRLLLQYYNCLIYFTVTLPAVQLSADTVNSPWPPCPGDPVTFTCRGIDLVFQRWKVGGSVVIIYHPDGRHSGEPPSWMQANLLAIQRNTMDYRLANFTSTLLVNDASLVNDTSVVCGDVLYTDEIIITTAGKCC